MKTEHTLFQELMKHQMPGMFSMKRYHEELGEEVPHIPLNKIGKFRLQNVLRRKFGVDWKNHGTALKILRDFETKMKVAGIK